MLDKKTKDKIIKKFRTHDADTGSSEVQIAILTEEIKQLTEHLKAHRKDFSSRRGLLRKVAERRRLLNYLRRENPESFQKLVKRLKLKVVKEVGEKVEEKKEEDVLEEGIEKVE